MDGTKLMIIMLMMNLFILLAMDLSYDAGLGMSPTWATQDQNAPAYADLIGHWGFDIFSYKENDPADLGWEQTRQNTFCYTDESGVQHCTDEDGAIVDYTDSMNSLQAESGATDIIGLGALSAVWTALNMLFNFLVKLIFAPFFLVWMIGLSNTIIFPIISIGYSVLIILMIGQWLWRFKL